MENKGGRMLFDGKNEEMIVQKLEEVFLMGGTDQEACLYANISKSAFYEWQKKNEWFLERKEALKANPILKARKTIIESLSNPLYAKWYLERRLKEEFSTRSELIGVGGREITGMSIMKDNGINSTGDYEEMTEKINDYISKLVNK